MDDSDDADYYEILQVHPAADARIIKNAYRTLLAEMRIHPDLGGCGERARRINAAYEVLSDPDQRARYDRRRAAARDADAPPARLPPGRAPAAGARLRRWGWTAVGLGLIGAAAEVLPTESFVGRLASAKAPAEDARPAAAGYFEAQTSSAAPRGTRGGAGILTDAEGHSWGVTSRPPSTAAASVPPASVPSATKAKRLLAALVPPTDPADAARRRRAAKNILIGSGALAAVLLWW
ncbi:MAG: J domain-containing protein [Elusimicrobia bacterium]|nr:J domain-containing protein [Elusimicrobiota bacterium]